MADGLRLPFTVDATQANRDVDKVGVKAREVQRILEGGAGFRIDADQARKELDGIGTDVGRTVAEIESGAEFKVDSSKAVREFGEIVDASGKAINFFDDGVELDIDTGDAKSELADVESAAKAAKSVVEDGADFNVDAGDAKGEFGGVESAAKSARSAVEEEAEVNIDTSKAKDSLGELESLAKKTVGAVSAGLGGELLAGVGEDASEINKELRLLQGRTGLVGEDFEKLRVTAENAFRKGIGESLQESIQFAADAQKQLGNIIPEDQLESATIRIGELAAATGEPYDAVAAKVRTLISQFPELQNNVGRAFDLIDLGAQKANTTQNDLLDTIAEYSKDFKGAGYSAEEMFSSFIKSSELGAFNLDKVGDSVKELGIRATEADITTELEAAFEDFGHRIPKKLQKDLSAVGNAVEAGVLSGRDALEKVGKLIEGSDVDEKIQLKLFRAFAGTPAEDLGKDIGLRAFTDFIPEAEIQKQAEEAGDLLEGAMAPQNAFEEWGKELEVLKGRTLATVGPMIQGFGNVTTSVAQVAPGLDLLFNKTKDLGGATGILNKFKGGVSGIGSAMKSLATGPVGIIAAIAAALFLAYNHSEEFRAAVDQLLAVLGEAFAPIAAELGGLLGDLVETLQPLLVVIGNVAGKLLTALMPAITIIADLLGILLGAGADLISTLLTGLTPAIEFLSTILGEVIGVVADLAAWLIDGLLSVLIDIGDFVSDVFIAGWDALVSVFETLWSAGKSIVDILFGFYSTIAKAALSVTGFVADLLGLGDAFNAVIGWVGDAVGAIGDFIGGLLDFGDAADEVQDKAVKASIQQQQSAAVGAKSAANAIGGFVTGLLKTNEKAGEEIPRAVSKGVKKGAGKAKGEVKKAMEDFASVMVNALRAAQDIEEKLRIDAIDNDLERLRASNDERIRLIRRGVSDELEAIDAKVAELEAKRADGYQVEIKNAEEARNALQVKQTQLEEQANAELLKQVEQYYDQRLSASRAANDKLVDEEKRRLELIRDLLDRESVTGLAEAIRIESELVDIELQKQIDAVVDTVPEFQAARDRIVAELARGEIDQAEAERQIGEARRDVIIEELKDDESIIALLTEQAEERRRQIKLDGIRETRRLEEEALQEENDLYRAALIVRDNLFASFYSDRDDERQKELQSELDKIEEEKDAYLDMFNEAKIGRDELFDKMRELGDREIEIIEEMESATKRLLDSLNQGLQTSLELFGDDVVDRAKTGLSNINTLMLGTDEEIKALGFDVEKVSEHIKEQTTDAAINAGAAIAAVTAQQALQGENILKSFARTTLDIGLKLLVAESKAVVALIFGKSVAANPLLGAALAAGLIGTFTILASLAKSALAGTGFRRGGFTGHGGVSDPAGVVHGQEFVFPEPITRKHRGMFEDILQGENPLQAAIKHSRPFWTQTFSNREIERQEMREFVTHVIETFGEEMGYGSAAVKELRELRKENEKLRERIEDLGEKFDLVAARFTSETKHKHEFGPVKVTGREVAWQIEQSKRDELSL